MRPRDDAKVRFTNLFVKRASLRPGLFWDIEQKGLALAVRPSGHKSYKAIYSYHGRPRWYHIGDAKAIDLAHARKQARRVMNAVAEGSDPQAERKAGTFEELAKRYVEEYAKNKNKSWRQADKLVRRYAIPRLGKLPAADIRRDDVKAMLARIGAPVLSNQVLAAASKIFSWAIKEEIIESNPCRLIDRNETRSRDRVLSDRELPLFWAAFGEAGVQGMALRLILLTGQRPGEVAHMRHEHIGGGLWTMPGEPVKTLGWPGTKNGESHRVWLPTAAQELITTDGEGFVLANRRGGPVNLLDAAMRAICVKLGIANKVTPHDLRRTHGTTITRLGFSRDAMN